MTKKTFIDTEVKAAIEEHLKSVTQQTAARWAIDCAEHVIHHYTQKYPKDDRLQKAIDACCLWIQGGIKVREVRKASFAAHAAARETDDEVTMATARAVGQAVATAHAFGHAIHASTYAVKAVAYAADFDNAAVQNERAWQYERLLELKKSM